MITIENLSFSYHKRKVLDDISLTVDDKSIVGIVGPNGAGKSTLIKLLTGALLPNEGLILFNKKPLHSSRKEILSKLAYLPEKITAYESLTILENLTYMCFLLNKETSSIDNILSMVGLLREKCTTVKSLSLGMKRLFTIAAAILKTPEILILDEPTNGLDPENIVKIRNILLELKNNFGVTIIVSSHNLEEIKRTADKIILLNNKKLIEINIPSDGLFDIEKTYFENKNKL